MTNNKDAYNISVRVCCRAQQTKNKESSIEEFAVERGKLKIKKAQLKQKTFPLCHEERFFAGLDVH